MKRILLAIALCAAIGCGTLKDVIWPATVTCGAPVAGALVDAIKQILLAGDAGWEAALEKLAAENGPELVACILGQLIDAWLPGDGERATKSLSDAAARAQGFLNNHETTVREQ